MLTLTLTAPDLAALSRGKSPDLAAEIAREHARRMDEVEALEPVHVHLNRAQRRARGL